jgi:hypothetical protein
LKCSKNPEITFTCDTKLEIKKYANNDENHKKMRFKRFKVNHLKDRDIFGLN